MFSALFDFAQRRPGLYFGLCCAGGLAIRYFWAGGDLGKFINPLFPLFQ